MSADDDARSRQPRDASPHYASDLDITLVNDLRELARVGAAINDLCHREQVPHRIGYAVNLSIEEILTCMISQGASEGDETRRIELALYLDEDQIEVLLASEGPPLADVELPQATLRSSAPQHLLDKARLEQLGLFLVHQVMDEVAFEHRQDCNVVVMAKRLS
ncbi:MAG: ATP-binding protein [Acidimicrobiaceae bacterium]|nr:ATP-binding protein [Acidimicrobiaceae bacterium]